MKVILAKSLPVLALTSCLLCNISASAQENTNTTGATAPNSSHDKAQTAVDEGKVVGAPAQPDVRVGSTWSTSTMCFTQVGGCPSDANIC